VTRLTKGLVIAALHVGLVCTLGVKLLVDRSVRPRAWVEVAPFDPDLPIRGRYVRLRVKADARGFMAPDEGFRWGRARLFVEDGRLIAASTDSSYGEAVQVENGAEGPIAVLVTPVAYFIPEHVPDPSSTPGLMVEVTVPRRGPPRPIRLGVKEDGRIVPFDPRDVKGGDTGGR